MLKSCGRAIMAVIMIRLLPADAPTNGPRKTVQWIEVMTMHAMTNRNKGFSIVELMIVVAVIGILIAVAVPAYFHHTMRVRQSEATENLLDMKAAQEMYYSQFNRYATSATDANYEPLLSFDLSDSRFFRYSISAAYAISYTARADGNNAPLHHDCWEINQDQAEPSQPAGCKPDGFSFSLF